MVFRVDLGEIAELDLPDIFNRNGEVKLSFHIRILELFQCLQVFLVIARH